jgi:hypothetical protein
MNQLSDLGPTQANQFYLAEIFSALKTRLDGAAPAPLPPPPARTATCQLADCFGLSPFEREFLLLAAGIEMDSELVAKLPAKLTFGLGLALLADPHWSALAPSAPLRRFRLIELESGTGLTAAPLRIDERILHYLAGINALDPRLRGILRRRAPPVLMAPNHLALLAELTADPAASGACNFCGDDPDGQEALAALIALHHGRDLFVLHSADTPAGAELDQCLQLWPREAMLLPATMLLQWGNDTPGAAATHLAGRLDNIQIASREPPSLKLKLRRVEVNRADPAGQRALWQEACGPNATAISPAIATLAAQYRLSAETISSIAATALSDSGDPNESAAKLWHACRAISRPALENLAERIVPAAQWDDLILPPAQLNILKQLAAQSRHRLTVHEDWGFAAKGRRGLGLSALFSGPSGTGKTLAAEVLAADLGLDLYRVDLSAIVSKYIGETEKNLSRLFDAAEGGGVMLLFDEADALFGKRTEVKDSHDRYANIETGYLLQRMERFQSIAILTTNLKTSIDTSFQRRFRFMLDFPFPDAAQRALIWSRAFPAAAPVSGLRLDRLASLSMSGGNIRNIALNAAFLAAAAQSPVEMSHVLQAAEQEAMKSERPLSQQEIRGWL